MDQPRLLLWGETQVGKTTLLAAGLLADPAELPLIDWTARAGDEDGVRRAGEELLRHWNRLRRNQLTLPTSEDRINLVLTFRGGARLTVRDIRGGLSRNPFDEDLFLAPVPRQGVLFVTEWEGRDMANHMTAIEGALRLIHNQKIGLAVTKCEKALDADDPGWLGRRGWWREHDCWAPYADLLERFETQVWATSAYGFDRDGRPACLLGEYGQIMPYQISPRNVTAPFRWFFKELGL